MMVLGMGLAEQEDINSTEVTAKEEIRSARILDQIMGNHCAFIMVVH